jgi:hypothetical protein
VELRLIPRDMSFYPLFRQQVAIVAEAAGILAAELRPVLISKEIYDGLEDAIDRTDDIGRLLDNLALSVGPGPSR